MLGHREGNRKRAKIIEIKFNYLGTDNQQRGFQSQLKSSAKLVAIGCALGLLQFSLIASRRRFITKLPEQFVHQT